MLRTSFRLLLGTLLLMAATGCEEPASDGPASTFQAVTAPAPDLTCDEDNGGIQLPEGFCAVVVADSLGRARHLSVRDNGDVYVALRRPADEGSIVALRDTDNDGRADVVDHFGEEGGTGIHLRGSYLYFAPDTLIMRYPLAEGELLPSGPPETVVSGFPRQRQHAVKPFEFDDAGYLYVNIGAPANACQDSIRTPGRPGLDPCPLLENHGGVWRFQADELGQTRDAGYRYATGIRNGVANAWNPFTGKLYVAQHGRDDLHRLWPDLYTDSLSRELPAEELFAVGDGSDFGWPYCYYDQLQGRKVLNPEYGGDGQMVDRCADADDPILAFPGHWAPNDLLFYTGGHFPERYQGGAFLAFHGSWNRVPRQQGYKVVFIPFEGQQITGDYEVFADGFTGAETLVSPGDARFRPMGLTLGPDGSLFITDSVQGRVWRVIYTG